jgi:uncharacterized protein YfaS (alpha-2-macroglobulin family)
MISAYGKEGDFAVLDLSRPAFDLSDRGVSGREAPQGLDAYLYTDRGIYRPGEAVKLTALIRDVKAMAAADVPLTLVVTRASGSEYRRLKQNTDALGGVSLSIEIPDNAGRGLWKVSAYNDPSGPPLGTVEFDVQDFVPERLKVSLKSQQPVLIPDTALDVAVEGWFLYGAPAGGLLGEAALKIMADPQPFPAWKDFVFGKFNDDFSEQTFRFKLDATDDSGKTHLSEKMPKLPVTSKPLKANLEAGLFEPGGRMTRNSLSLPIKGQDLWLGIKPLFKEGRVRSGQEAEFEVIALDGEGKPVERSDLSYGIVEENWDYLWSRNSGRWEYQTIVRDTNITWHKLASSGQRPQTIRYKNDWGRYRLVVRDGKSNITSSMRFRFGWGGGGSPNSDTPDKLDLAADKDKYGIGETVQLAINPSFAGEAQIIIAGERVHQIIQTSVPVGGKVVEIPVTGEWGIGAYALVRLMRPLAKEASHEPARSIGIAWLPIDMSAQKLEVRMEVPETIRPRGKFKLPVTVAGAVGEEVNLTLAAVDEGILQLTRFVSPAPEKHFFAKRRFPMSLRDDYGRLLDYNSGKIGAIREGGDGIGGAGLPVVPTRSVVLFSGPVKLDKGGKAVVELDIPDFNGQLRLMGVAYGKTKIGSGSAKLTVRDPLIAEVILPRFLAPGDSSHMTMLLQQVDGEAGEIKVKLTTNGEVSGSGPIEKTYRLGKGEKKVEIFPLIGGKTGTGEVKLVVAGPNKFAVERSWPIAVRHPFRPLELEQTAIQKDGEAFRYEPKLAEAFVPGTLAVSVGYNLTQGIDVPGILQSLYRYPYGCSEQITSAALPLLLSLLWS